MSRNKENTDQITTVINLSGLIQGIGFRPFIFKLARQFMLKGTVINQNNGVRILLQGKDHNIASFISQIKIQAPKAAIITDLFTETAYYQIFEDFSIAESETYGNAITLVSPDIGVCDECLEDMKSQAHRIDYSFINCTNCGPRFSIIKDIPYDRKQTSMEVFGMCSICEKEYTDIYNRRFHAQPVACNNCGPSYTLNTQETTITGIKEILQTIATSINSGEVIAMKGIGGYHLVCDPYNQEALRKLRQIKLRDSKPFALMVRSQEIASALAFINKTEKHRLLSWQRPIVLLKAKNKEEFPEDIACGLKTLGIFLPYMPFHYQIFENIKQNALVMTSANLSHCPIITDENAAFEQFTKHNIPVLSHNRKIINRVDDSVEQYSPLCKQVIRRSRGYAPLPLLTNIQVDGILATGAELSGAFAIGKDKQIILSQHIGDLKNFETMQFYEESYSRMKKLFRFTPAAIACDMHPDYLSTAFAEQFKLPLLRVQHHHAHIAACMAEYGLDDRVIGVAYDGTGYGTDGKIWGSEIMIAGYTDIERKYHFEYVPVPGGDKVAEEPWRSAYSYLYRAENGLINSEPEFLHSINAHQKDLIHKALKYGINIPESSSAGRLFDAIAALINCCTHASYHAEAPIKLENSIFEGIDDFYPVNLEKNISWSETIKAIVNDLSKNINPGIISALFHNSVAKVTSEAILQIHNETGLKKIILTGGTFQNVYLTKKIVDLLSNKGLQIFMPSQLPCNDGGIAAGQMVIAAKKNELCV